MIEYVVIGAAKPGIGAAITKKILAEGNSVIGTYEKEDEDTAHDLIKNFPGLNLSVVDHRSTASLEKFVANLNAKIGGVVFAQMFFEMSKAEGFSSSSWENSLEVNLTMPHRLTLALGPQIRKGGGLVTVTSTEGFIGSFGAASYAATKAAIHNLVKTHANILGPQNVRANAVAAGWIGGVMDTDEVFNMSRRITPLRRLGLADEIANVVWFLLSDQSSFVTGATIVADGGYTCVDTIAQYEYETFLKGIDD